MAPLLRDVAGQLETMTGEQGWIASLRFGAAGALADMGEHDAAIPLYRHLVKENPRHSWAWIGLIDALSAVGEHADAVAVGHEALRQLPENMVLWNRTAAVLRDHAGAAEAADFFAAALGGDPKPSDLQFAISLYREAGQVGRAADISRRLLGKDPDAAVAHMALIEGALEAGDGTAARQAALAALDRTPDHPELLLRIAQGLLSDGDAARALEVLERIPQGSRFDDVIAMLRSECSASLEQGAFVSEPEAEAMPAVGADDDDPGPGDVANATMSVANADDDGAAPDLADLDTALAKGDVTESAAILEKMIHRRDLPWYVALHLVDRAMREAPRAAVDGLLEVFAEAAWSEEDRNAFEIEQRLLRIGPRCARDWIKAHPVGRRDREAAERLGRVLLDGGAGFLAARYLRACCRRWPDDPALARLKALACEACGMSLASDADDTDEGPSLLALAEDGARSPEVALIEASILAGDLVQAEACLARVSVNDGPLEEALVCRPRATRIGSLVNEARILAAAGLDWTGDDVAGLAEVADGFFLPARQVLSLGPAAQSGAPEAAPIADTVHMIWPGPAGPTAEAERLFQAWREATRRDVTVHQTSDPLEMLAEAGGDRAVRAFRATREPKQKADIMRLALAVVVGGTIVTADQWPGAAVDTLLDEADGAMLFRDRDGSISLDAMVMPAGHVLARHALDLLVASCEARDNDHRWFKSGPGLMTRAAATLARATGQADVSVRFRPIADLRRHMHRHATVVSASGHQGREGSGGVLAKALRDVLDADTIATHRVC